jgi:tetratricopeptide (TPR) repeat protein
MTDQNLSDIIFEGRRCLERGDFQSAIARFEQAAHQARAWGEGENELIALGWLPAAWGSLSDHVREVETATRLLTRARELHREDYEMIATQRLAEAMADLDLRGRWRELKPLLLQGLETSRRLGKTWYEIYHMMLLGTYAVKVGDGNEGHKWLKDALNLLRPDIERNTVPKCLFRLNIYSALSTLMRQRGDLDEALRYAEQTVGVAQRDNNPAFVADARLILARAHRARGEYDQALQVVHEVLPLARSQNWRGIEQEAEYLLGELERETGQPDGAEVAARRALMLAQEMKLREEEVQSMISLGHALIELRDHGEAQEMLTQARRMAQERDYEDYFQQAEKLLGHLAML